MFEQLQERLRRTFDQLRGRGKLSPADVRQALREVRIALLDADVNFRVARSFVQRLEPTLLGEDVMQSLTPGQTVIKHVRDALQELLGGETARLRLGSTTPSVVLLVGLQGAGKTTFAAKLAQRLRSEGRWPRLAACDLKRPAAVEQLMQLGERVGVPVTGPQGGDPVATAQLAIESARREGQDAVIVDSAGRQEIDDEMMDELRQLRAGLIQPTVLLVVDAMTGQAAANTASAFDEQIGIDGVALSKLDGDARGGAAISVREVTGKPIYFASVGERPEQLEPFHPDRMAQRILGMGDVLGLIERAQAQVAEQDEARMQERLRKGSWTLEDFLEQLQAVRRMGPIKELMAMIPGLGKRLRDLPVDDRELLKAQAMIQSMTREERRDPRLINGSRRRRIARGAGVAVHDVNRLLKQFDEMRRMMKTMRGMRGRMPQWPVSGPERR